MPIKRNRDCVNGRAVSSGVPCTHSARGLRVSSYAAKPYICARGMLGVNVIRDAAAIGNRGKCHETGVVTKAVAFVAHN
jgi:hypothetical protein